MFFKQVKVGLMENFSYIIGSEGEATVVDPGWEYKKLIDICNENKLKIKKILLTHVHYDHVLDLKKIVKKTNATVYVHKLENLKSSKNSKNFLGHKTKEIKDFRGFENKVFKQSQSNFFVDKNMKIINIKDNDIINVGKIKIKVLHTPGHSLGGVCFLFDKKLLSGDSLFVGAIGRVDLPGSSEEDMMKSLKKLSKLDDNIEVYPGHDYGEKPSSTIGYEKKNNAFMKF